MRKTLSELWNGAFVLFYFRIGQIWASLNAYREDPVDKKWLNHGGEEWALGPFFLKGPDK